MGRKNSTLSDLIGHTVLVNDVDGDAFKGACFQADETGLVLVTSAGSKVVYIRSDGQQVPLEGYCQVPAGRVKFVQVVT